MKRKLATIGAVITVFLSAPGAVLALRELAAPSKPAVYVIAAPVYGGAMPELPAPTDPHRLRCGTRRCDGDRVTLEISEDSFERMRAGEPLLLDRTEAGRLGLGVELVLKVGAGPQ
ncbi:MAG: hypothetical protein ACLQBB_04375 [Solirubrobacteraceae bacterium]